MANSINFDKIQLSGEDATKPADIQKDTHDENVTEPTPPDAAAAAKANAEKETVKEVKPATPATTDPVTPPADATPAENAEDKKLTPFHEHPDWKKMQAETEHYKEEVTKLQGQIELISKQNAVSKEEKAVAKVSAKDRLEKDIENGWEPKSQMEMTLRYGEYLKEEMKAEADEKEAAKAAKEKEQSDAATKTQSEVATAVSDTFTALKLTTDDQKNKVAAYAQKMIEDGIASPDPKKVPDLLRHAHEVLTARGELATETKPVVTETEESKKEKEAKNNVNKLISRPRTSSTLPDTQQPRVQLQLKNKRDLDEIVRKAGEALG